jgi:hypothetical protein
MKGSIPVSVNRDEAIERLLGRGGATAPQPADACLAADTIAGWFEGTLQPDERAAAERHASACDRCQAVLAAMAATEPAVPARPAHGLRLVRWLVPAAAIAAAVLFWVNLRVEQPRLAPAAPPSASATADNRSTDAAPSLGAATSAPREERKVATATVPPASRTKPVAKQAAPQANEALSQLSEDSLRAAAPQPAQSPARERADTLAGESPMLGPAMPPLQVTSGAAVIWRVTARDTIARSADGGASWVSAKLDAPADFTAGAAADSATVWFVGRRGVVVRGVGDRYERRSIAEPVDLVAVRPADAMTATVTAVDGRTFTTRDGGLTWLPGGLQENPAAPF